MPVPLYRLRPAPRPAGAGWPAPSSPMQSSVSGAYVCPWGTPRRYGRSDCLRRRPSCMGRHARILLPTYRWLRYGALLCSHRPGRRCPTDRGSRQAGSCPRGRRRYVCQAASYRAPEPGYSPAAGVGLQRWSTRASLVQVSPSSHSWRDAAHSVCATARSAAAQIGGHAAGAEAASAGFATTGTTWTPLATATAFSVASQSLSPATR